MPYDGKATITMEIERRGQTLQMAVTGTSYFRPGRLSGPPELCYPDEGATEIMDVSPPGYVLTLEEQSEAIRLIDDAVGNMFEKGE